MKVYALREGDEYMPIRGIYSTREIAERVSEATGWSDDMVEFEVDLHVDKLLQGLLARRVYFYEDGRIDVVSNGFIDTEGEAGQFELYPREEDTTRIRYGGMTTVWSRNEDEAMEVYRQRRAALIASGQYKPGEPRENMVFQV